MTRVEDLIRPLVERVKQLTDRVSMVPVVRWGTVLQVAPLRVVLDGDAEPLPFEPQNTIPGLMVGNRVLCVEQHRRVMVTQVAGRVSPWAVAQGRVPITPTPNTPTGVTVTFPAGRFSVSPRVQVSVDSAVPGTQVLGVSSSGTTPGGTTLYLTRTNDAVTSVNWMAVQMGESVDG